MELPVSSNQNRFSIYHRLVPGSVANTGTHPGVTQSLHRKPSTANLGSNPPSRSQTPLPRTRDHSQLASSLSALPPKSQGQSVSPSTARRVSYATSPLPPQPGYTPLLESVDHAVKNTSMHLPDNMTTDDFTRAVAVATVSALRHQQTHYQSPARQRASAGGAEVDGGGGHGGDGGHDAPSWSRTTSASVLLACTALYALIAGMDFFAGISR